MSKDKYPSIFSPQMATIVFIILQIFFATREVLKIGEYSRISSEERTLRNPSEGGHLETTSDDEIRGRPRSPSYCKPVINMLDIQTRTESARNPPSFKKRLNTVKKNV